MVHVSFDRINGINRILGLLVGFALSNEVFIFMYDLFFVLVF